MTSSVHTAFCAECTSNFDWKSIGMYHSHAQSGMPGRITRLLACSKAQLATYRGLELGPTFVHQNYGTGVEGYDSSPTYNKPGSLMHWLLETEVEEEFILYVDADMLLRKPLDVLAMGAKLGTVVSEHVGYLDVGIGAGLPEQFIPAEQARKAAAAGWYHILATPDARRIAPRWLHFCRQVRQHPERYWAIPGRSNLTRSIPTGDAYVSFGGVPWIAEMYGYVLAAAEAGVDHVLTDGVVVYSDDAMAPGRVEPSIIHYGLHCYIQPQEPLPAGTGASGRREGRAGSDRQGKYHFTKYNFGAFDIFQCKGALIPPPPRPMATEALCAETVEWLNDALCAFYAKHCGLAVECPAHQQSVPAPCLDIAGAEQCRAWAEGGECARNPGFMLTQCRESCKVCRQPGVLAAAVERRLPQGQLAPAAAAADGAATEATADTDAAASSAASEQASAEASPAAIASPSAAVAALAGAAPGHGGGAGSVRGPAAAVPSIDAHERFAAVEPAPRAGAAASGGAAGRMQTALRSFRQLSPFQPHGQALETEAGSREFAVLVAGTWALLFALLCAPCARCSAWRRLCQRQRQRLGSFDLRGKSPPGSARERERRRASLLASSVCSADGLPLRDGDHDD